MGSVFSFDDYEYDVAASELRRGGVPVRSHALILRLLDVFVRNPGRLVTKSELLDQVWAGRPVSDNSLTVAIRRLRATLADGGDFQPVLTVHGRGYRFTRDVSCREPSNPPPHDSAGNAPDFIGRAAELSRLREALAAAGRGSGGLLVLRGEGGIGKTRIAEVLAREAAEAQFSVVWGYCRIVGAAPALSRVPADRLRDLPCDRDYLGTLGALTRATLQLRALDYARVLYELLLPYSDYFALNISFVCEGSVSHLLGLLARSFGDLTRARQHFHAAIHASEKADLWGCAADSQRELESLALNGNHSARESPSA